MEWLESWPSPGVCQLARSQVVERRWWRRGRHEPSIIWLLAHDGEAALIDAPFGREDATEVLPRVRGYLAEHQLRMKYVTASTLDPAHAAGLAATLAEFPDAGFVYPAAWRHRLRPSLFRPTAFSRAELNACWDHPQQVAYESSVALDLSGEPLLAFDTPLRGLTDQVVVFRGVALSPESMIEAEALATNGSPSSVHDGATEDAVTRLSQLGQQHGYTIHSVATVEGRSPVVPLKV